MVKGKKTSGESEQKMIYTHGKKRNSIANVVIQEGKGLSQSIEFQYKILNLKHYG